MYVLYMYVHPYVLYSTVHVFYATYADDIWRRGGRSKPRSGILDNKTGSDVKIGRRRKRRKKTTLFMINPFAKKKGKKERRKKPLLLSKGQVSPSQRHAGHVR